MTSLAGLSSMNIASDWYLRVAGASAMVNGLGFGGFTIPAIWSVASGHGVLYANDKPTYGYGPLYRLGVPTTVPLLAAFLIACTVLASGGVLLLWPRPSGILVSLIGILMCAPFGWGFDLPLAWPKAAQVVTLIAIGWTFRRSDDPSPPRRVVP